MQLQLSQGETISNKPETENFLVSAFGKFCGYRTDLNQFHTSAFSQKKFKLSVSIVPCQHVIIFISATNLCPPISLIYPHLRLI